MNHELDCDCLIFFATRSEEDALRNAAENLGIPFKLKKHRVLGKYCHLGTLGSLDVAAVKTEMGSLGFGGSASRGIIAQNYTGATAIIQIGMAFGADPATQRIGDILVSTEVIPYDARTILHDPTGTQPYIVDYSGAGRFPANQSMITLFRSQAETHEHFRVFFGAMLSGGARIFSPVFRDELVAQAPAGDERIIGGEMECAGLLSVSRADDPPWIVVKGISDFADGQRDAEIEQTRPIACGNAARFVLRTLTSTASEAVNDMEKYDA